MTIRYVGETTADMPALRALLEENGVYPGAAQEGISEHYTAEALLLEFDSLSWAAVNLFPGYAQIEMREKAAIPESPYPTGMVMLAKYDAIVTEIQLLSGVTELVPGSPVRKGELIARGGTSSLSGSWAQSVVGTVRGLIEARAELFIPRTYETQLFTGRENRRLSLIFAGRELRLYIPGLGGFASYQTIESRRPLRLFGVETPITIREITERQTLCVSTEVTHANVGGFAQRLLAEYEAANFAESELRSRSYSCEPVQEGWRVSAQYLLETEIYEMVEP